MITGARAAARALALLAALAIPAPGTVAAPAGWGVEQLMQQLAQVKSVKARFTERKYLDILDAPLDSRGTLFYSAPGRLEKHTLAPREERMVLEGDRLVLEDRERNERRTFPLDQQPALLAFVESIRATLAGDIGALRRHYDVALEGDPSGWRLVLRPVRADMRRLVGEIRIGGRASRVERVEVIETGGDHSVMTIQPNG